VYIECKYFTYINEVKIWHVDEEISVPHVLIWSVAF
jgi:hypothetical protein